MLLSDSIRALALFTPYRLYVESHFLGEHSTDEAADAVVLPVRRFRNVRDRRAIFPPPR